MTDADEDGFGDNNPAAGVLAGSDCDDSNALLQPLDADGDGYTGCAGDCDDTDASLNADDRDGDGYSNCNGDCDDTDRFTYTGAAELESPNKCMTDADEDGYGDPNPTAAGAEPGTDCDDTNSQVDSADLDNDGQTSCDGDCDDNDNQTYIGAAEIEAPTLCMQDTDNDGYGDISPTNSATPGTDCDDDSNKTFPVPQN